MRNVMTRECDAHSVARGGDASQKPQGTVEERARGPKIDHGEDSAATLAWAGLLLAAVWVAFIRFVDWPAFLDPLFSPRAWVDSAVYSSAGELIRGGGIPYLSYCDHKPPLIHLINAGALALSGGHLWGVRFLNYAVLITTLDLAGLTLS